MVGNRIAFGKEELIVEEGDMMIRIPNFLKSKAESVHEFCLSIFPDLDKNIQEGLRRIAMKDRGCFDWLMTRAIICPTNADCEEYLATPILGCNESSHDLLHFFRGSCRNGKRFFEVSASHG